MFGSRLTLFDEGYALVEWAWGRLPQEGCLDRLVDRPPQDGLDGLGLEADLFVKANRGGLRDGVKFGA